MVPWWFPDLGRQNAQGTEALRCSGLDSPSSFSCHPSEVRNSASPRLAALATDTLKANSPEHCKGAEAVDEGSAFLGGMRADRRLIAIDASLHILSPVEVVKARARSLLVKTTCSSEGSEPQKGLRPLLSTTTPSGKDSTVGCRQSRTCRRIACNLGSCRCKRNKRGARPKHLSTSNMLRHLPA